MPQGGPVYSCHGARMTEQGPEHVLRALACEWSERQRRQAGETVEFGEMNNVR